MDPRIPRGHSSPGRKPERIEFADEEKRRREVEQTRRLNVRLIVVIGAILLSACLAVIIAGVVGFLNSPDIEATNAERYQSAGVQDTGTEQSSGEAAGDAAGAGESDAVNANTETVEAEVEEKAAEPAPISPEYPTAWLIAEDGGVPAFTPVDLAYAPDIAVLARREGQAIPADEMESIRGSWKLDYAGQAVVLHDGQPHAVSTALLMVNLPDVLDSAVYDAVYSYSATSKSGGKDIPGVTGERIDGYADGRVADAYLGRDEFIVPCAYGTAVKTAAAEQALESAGYRMLVYDAYRPMRAQMALSDMFQAAYGTDPDITAAVSAWGTEWYVASGASGHNYGTDLDVGVCDMEGNPLPMPSDFDAFDVSGTLTSYPLSPGSITPESYRPEVSGNGACMQLHRAFTEAGFSELSSEWWHFADEETESERRGIVGDGGLDFVAAL